MRLRPDLVLVALPKWSAVERRRGSVLLPAMAEHDRLGLVLLTGEAVTSVRRTTASCSTATPPKT